MTNWAATNLLGTGVANTAPVFTHNGFLYVLGGMTNTGTLNSAISTTQKAAINGDGSLGAFANDTALTADRRSMGCAVNSTTNRVYIVGGNNDAGTGLQTVDHSPINAMTGALGAWVNTTNIPAARSFPICFFGTSAGVNTLYVVCGAAASETTTVYRGAINTGTGNIASWTTGATPFPEARRCGHAVVIGNTVYVFGGQISTPTYYLDSMYYATVSGGGDLTWTQGPRLSSPVSRANVCVDGDYIFVHHSDELQALDTTNLSAGWQVITSKTPARRNATQSTVYGSHLYVVGGVSQSDAGILSAAAEDDVYYNSTPLSIVDTTAPVMQNLTPADTSTIAPTDNIEFEIFDNTPGLSSVTVWVKSADSDQELVVYNGTDFLAPFDDNSTFDDNSGVFTWAFSIEPNDLWTDDIELSVRAVDLAGNVFDEKLTYTVSPHYTGPTISNISPANASTIAPGASVSFRVSTTAAELRLVTIALLSADDPETKLVFDGDAFLDPFDTNSIFDDNGGLTTFDFTIEHNDIWTDDIQIFITAVDELGNTTEQTLTYTVSPHYTNVAPVISNVSPVDASTIERGDPIEFRIADTQPGLETVVVYLKYSSREGYRLVYNGAAFLGRFAGNSSVVGPVTQRDFEIASSLGWDDNFQLFIQATDAEGAITSQTLSYTVIQPNAAGEVVMRQTRSTVEVEQVGTRVEIRD